MIGIISAPVIILIPLFFTETHHPIILVEKAREIRRRTGIWGIQAPHDRFTFTIQEVVQKTLTRPLRMLFTEPILFLISLYMSFIYGMVYLFLTAYPIVFQRGYKMKPGVAELPFIGLIIGEFFGGVFCIFQEKKYRKKLASNGNRTIPEARLPMMIPGAVAFPIGVLWFCWTGHYHDDIPWIVPTLSGLFTGFGILVIFIPAMNYIIDSYLVFAASAMAANTFLRSAFGGGFPLFAEFMFDDMHTNWAGMVLGLFGVALILCPVLFTIYGKKLRQTSKYAFDLNE
ncbi:unnamed protein product [Ambrosiozyma monospora]|uniref:Unnamed protein product n=1 Tax=Ambrosiozyma monospora TaxID=43982 RepID=A0ACB5U1D7_AMBMO|nr:unnamed protein product [Ambrosiozyma monospora]